MSLEIGNLIGAITHGESAASSPKGLKSFLKTINKFGIQVGNNFEVHFSALDSVIFYVQSITAPGMQFKTTEVNYNGQVVEIPIMYDFEHEVTLTIINDGQGYIYSTLVNFFIKEGASDLADSGYTMVIKALNGDSKYSGGVITLNGVRVSSISGLEFGHSNNDIQTFTLSLKCAHFTFSPGALGKTSNVIGVINSLIN